MIEERTSIVSIPRFAESVKDAERDARRSLRALLARMLVLHLRDAGLSEFDSGGLSHMDA